MLQNTRILGICIGTSIRFENYNNEGVLILALIWFQLGFNLDNWTFVVRLIGLGCVPHDLIFHIRQVSELGFSQRKIMKEQESIVEQTFICQATGSKLSYHCLFHIILSLTLPNLYQPLYISALDIYQMITKMPICNTYYVFLTAILHHLIILPV